MVKEEETDEVQNYVQTILTNARNFEFIFSYSSHQLTNLILARYQEIASKRNIKVKFQAELPEVLTVNDDDLTQILIHVLEHSFRETHAIEDPTHRKIYLSMQEKENQLSRRAGPPQKRREGRAEAQGRRAQGVVGQARQADHHHCRGGCSGDCADLAGLQVVYRAGWLHPEFLRHPARRGERLDCDQYRHHLQAPVL